VVTLTNPELWVETTRYRNARPYTEARPAAEVTRYRNGAPLSAEDAAINALEAADALDEQAYADRHGC